MNNKNKHNMYKLLRNIGDSQGIARTTILSLESFIKAIEELECSEDKALGLYLELAEAIKSSQPKIISLIHLLEFFEKEMEEFIKTKPSMETLKEKTTACIQDQIEMYKSNAEKVTEYGLKFVENGDIILVHSASSVVTKILIRAKKNLNLMFRVIILDHNKDRTRQLVQALQEHDIEHQITRSSDISHYIEMANKMFLGALTITADKKIIAPSGTAGTVSMCHVNNVKVFLFANTLHYSHGTATDQYIYEEESESSLDNAKFPVTTHSHDVINLDMIDHIINESGEMHKDICPSDPSAS